MSKKFLFTIFFSSIILTACSNSDVSAPQNTSSENTHSKQTELPDHSPKVFIEIPTDQQATYEVLAIQKHKNTVEIMTKREGPSGTSYAHRVYDCKNWTTKYLGDGDTIEEMKNSSPDKDMAPIVEHSIAYYQAKFGCK